MPITSVISAASQGAAGSSFRQLEQGISKRLDQSGPLEIGTSESQQSGSNFTDMVKDFVSDVNAHQIRSGKTIDAFAAGEVTDVHQVMVAVQEAGLALDLLIEIRNRTQEAFQEIMRIQV